MIVRSQRMKLDQIDYPRSFALRMSEEGKKKDLANVPRKMESYSFFLRYKRRYLHWKNVMVLCQIVHTFDEQYSIFSYTRRGLCRIYRSISFVVRSPCFDGYSVNTEKDK